MENYLKEFLDLSREIQKKRKESDEERTIREWLSYELQKEIELEEIERMSKIEKAIIRHF